MAESSERIFIVEDNRDTARTLGILLERRGYTVLHAYDVQQGIATGSAEAFDLLICDIGLPDGDGMDVIRALRKKKKFPAIALTAHSSDKDVADQKAAGFDHHVSKPYLFPELAAVIRTMLTMRAKQIRE